MTKAVEKSQSRSETTRVASGIGYPVSNDAYDVIAALQAKLEGLEAYRKYFKDGHEAMWRDLAEADTQAIDKLIGELEELVKSGRLRAHHGGH